MILLIVYVIITKTPVLMNSPGTAKKRYSTLPFYFENQQTVLQEKAVICHEFSLVK